MDNNDILKRLIKNDALFNNVHIFTQNFDIVPNDKEHVGAYIEYQDLFELRDEFLSELIDSITDWIYSSEKYSDLKQTALKNGKSESAAANEVNRKAKAKFRANSSTDKLLIQGQFGELLLFHFIQRIMKAVPLLRKMKITTSPDHERFGADAIHYKIEDSKNIIILGEAKTYSSKYKFKQAFADALESIISTYKNHRKELGLYVHEDFLDNEMDQIAEAYLNNTLKDVEVSLVSIIIYDENQTIDKDNVQNIKNQIESIISERYHSFDNDKIDIVNNPILKRITYIIFPIWDLKDIVERFQNLIGCN